MEEIDTVVEEKIKTVVTEPKRYKVIFLNDDNTPMEWVIEVLRTIFGHDTETATELTMQIHTSGSAVAGTYSYEIAEQKMFETITASRTNGFPLQLTIEATS